MVNCVLYTAVAGTRVLAPVLYPGCCIAGPRVGAVSPVPGWVLVLVLAPSHLDGGVVRLHHDGVLVVGHGALGLGVDAEHAQVAAQGSQYKRVLEYLSRYGIR